MRGSQSLLEQDLVGHTCGMGVGAWPLLPGATALNRTTNTVIVEMLKVFPLPRRLNARASSREQLIPQGWAKAAPSAST